MRRFSVTLQIEGNVEKNIYILITDYFMMKDINRNANIFQMTSALAREPWCLTAYLPPTLRKTSSYATSRRHIQKVALAETWPGIFCNEGWDGAHRAIVHNVQYNEKSWKAISDLTIVKKNKMIPTVQARRWRMSRLGSACPSCPSSAPSWRQHAGPGSTAKHFSGKGWPVRW